MGIKCSLKAAAMEEYRTKAVLDNTCLNEINLLLFKNDNEMIMK